MERTIDQQIEDHHREVEQSEHDALAIDNRLRGVGGLDQYMAQPRPYGTLRNPWSGAGNVTAQTLIMQQDRALATFLAQKAGQSLPAVDYVGQQQRELAAQQRQAMVDSTAQLREANLARQQRHQNSRLNGRWDPLRCKVI